MQASLWKGVSSVGGTSLFTRPVQYYCSRLFNGLPSDQRMERNMSYIVGHDKNAREFYIHLRDQDGQKSADRAFLQYAYVRKDLLDMYHTFVPDSFRGKGIAKILAKDAMDYAVAEDLKMKLSCTYLQKYIQDNPLPQYKERIVQ